MCFVLCVAWPPLNQALVKRGRKKRREMKCGGGIVSLKLSDSSSVQSTLMLSSHLCQRRLWVRGRSNGGKFECGACLQIKGSSGILNKITFSGEDHDFLLKRQQALEVRLSANVGGCFCRILSGWILCYWPGHHSLIWHMLDHLWSIHRYIH